MKNQTFEEESKAILKGLEKAHEEMVKFKKAKGTPLVVSDHGKIKHIPAKDIHETTTHTREYAVIDFTIPGSMNFQQ